MKKDPQSEEAWQMHAYAHENQGDLVTATDSWIKCTQLCPPEKRERYAVRVRRCIAEMDTARNAASEALAALDGGR